MIVTDSLIKIQQTENLQDLTDSALEISKKMGMDGFYYANVKPLVGAMSIDPRSQEWKTRFHRGGYQHFDVITQAALVNVKPFLWEEAIVGTKLSKEQHTVLNEASDFGFQHGYNVLSHGEGFDRATCCFYGGESKIFFDSYEYHRKDFEAIGHAIHEKFEEFNSPWPDKPILTTRERECLSWAASGFTNDDIGQKLSISANTVGSYIQTAAQRLGVRTKTHTIVKAIQLELIYPF